MGSAIVRFIDAVNEWVAKYFSLLIIPLVLIVTVDVVLRYIFNRPLVWSWDINSQLLGVIAVMGAGYALLQRAHIGVDVFVMRLSPRTRAIIDMITAPLFFLAMGVLIWKSGQAAWTAILRKEVVAGVVNTPLYPFRVIMVIGIVLFALQGISKFISDFRIATGREESGS